MNRLTKIALLAACLLSISGCRYVTGDNGILRDRRGDYTEAQILPPMAIPIELDSYTIDQLYVIPASVAVGEEAFDEIPLPKPIEARRSEGVVIQALGGKRWIVIDATPSQVWPLVRDYWTSLQIFLDYENPGSGIMETAWVEIDSDRENRHKYRIVIEPGLHSGYSEIYITHLQNLREDPIPVVITWPEASSSQDLERDIGDSISQYLADRNDLYQASSASLLAGSIEAESKANIIETEPGKSVLELKLDYNRAWVIVRQALEAAEVDITEQNRDESFYSVRFAGIQEEVDEPGFFGRLIGRGRSSDNEAEMMSYTVRLLEENNSINVVTEPLESADSVAAKELELLQVIDDNLS